MKIKTIDVEKIKKKFQSKYNNGTLREFIVKRIYSDKGIIEVDKSGKLWNMEIIDEKPSSHMLENNIQIYIDKSTIKRKEEVFQIVPEHLSVVTKKLIFNLSSTSMVIEMTVTDETVTDETVTDIYFETEIDINEHYVRENIVTFLALLNFIESI